VTTSWGNEQVSVLRTGCEFSTLAQGFEQQYASAIKALPFPPQLLIEPAILSKKDMMGHLIEYLKGLLRIEHEDLQDVVSKFLRDPVSIYKKRLGGEITLLHWRQTVDFFTPNFSPNVKEDEVLQSVRFDGGGGGGGGDIRALAVSPMRRFADRTSQMVLLATGSERTPNGTDLHIYDFDEGLIKSYERHIEGQVQGRVAAARFSSDGDYFFTVILNEEEDSSNDAAPAVSFEITVWTLDTLTAVLTLNGSGFPVLVNGLWLLNDIMDVAVTRRKNDTAHLIAFANTPKSVSVWCIEEHTLVRSTNVDLPKGNCALELFIYLFILLFSCLAGLDGIRSVRFHPTEPSSQLAIGGDHGIQIWDHAKNEFLLNIKYKATAIALSPDGKRIAAVGTVKSKVKIWDLRTGKTVKSLACGFSLGTYTELKEKLFSIYFLCPLRSK